jgi:hypothetical protein
MAWGLNSYNKMDKKFIREIPIWIPLINVAAYSSLVILKLAIIIMRTQVGRTLRRSQYADKIIQSMPQGGVPVAIIRCNNLYKCAGTETIYLIRNPDIYYSG